MEFRNISFGFILLAWTFIVLVSRGGANICSPTCNKAWCKKPEGCEYGIVDDICGCCKICAAGPGERCGGPYKRFGPCGEGLICMETGGAGEGGPGMCVEQKEKSN